MKSINVKESFELEGARLEGGKPFKTTVGDGIVLTALRQGPRGDGVNLEEMGRCVSVINKCKDAAKSSDGIMLLEKDEYDTLMACIRGNKWVVDCNLFAQIENIKNLKDAQVKLQTINRAAPKKKTGS